MPPNKATLHHQPTGMYRIAGKRALDLTLVLLMAPTVLVVIVLLAAVIALDGKSPFYCQNRVGRNGRVYRMWKLRSMTPNADAALKQYLADNPDARREWDANQKLRHDPRITRFGKLIRQTSLDELPQLWNVVKGEMSLVGPRPMMCEQRILYPGTEYYDMLPGITGYWQTSVRNESSFRDRAQFDAAYHRDLSVGTDIKVLLATVSVVMSATGH
nr:sugar transferase [Thalassovita sp.]